MVKKSRTSSQRGKQTKEKESEWILSPDEIAELEALKAMPDEEIDYSDIPEVFDFSDWKRVHYRPVKHQISFRVDVDVLIFFQMAGKGYQTKMNKVLRDYMRLKRREAYIAEFGEPTEEDRKLMPGGKKVAVKLKPRKKKAKVAAKTKTLVPTRSKRKKSTRKKNPRK
ncbi:MAG: BrnA antitoxin family protein [Candidatus Obscuribacterales bacterium]|nr:BrnA antitoxin family protein [Candidatus Obscuribacterales bacterium]